MINIQIDDEYIDKLQDEPLRLAALTVLAHQQKPAELEINIVITSDYAMQKINKEYRGFDEPTDVLSFESGIVDPETEISILGDILISYSQAYKQAVEQKHDLTEELQLLTVHGCLHLFGIDHQNKAQKDKMWEAQDEILSAIDVKARP
jgi:probable rRNA maturation factor